MAEFLVLIHADEDELVPAETKARVEGHAAYEQKLREAAAFVDGERLSRHVDLGREARSRGLVWRRSLATRRARRSRRPDRWQRRDQLRRDRSKRDRRLLPRDPRSRAPGHERPRGVTSEVPDRPLGVVFCAVTATKATLAGTNRRTVGGCRCPNVVMRHPHAILGVDPHADLATIKRAFRRLAKELHPDRSADPRAGLAFRELLWAYDQAKKDAAARAMWASIRPEPQHEPPSATSAVDFEPMSPSAWDTADPELRVPASAFCTRAYQERLTRIVVSGLVGSVVVCWVSALCSHF